MITHLFLNDPDHQDVRERFNQSTPSDGLTSFSGYIGELAQKITTYAGSVMNPDPLLTLVLSF